MNWLALFLSIAIVAAVVLIFGRGEYNPEVGTPKRRCKKKIHKHYEGYIF